MPPKTKPFNPDEYLEQKKPAFDPDAYLSAKTPTAEELTPLERLENVSRSALKGLTLGLSEPVVSGFAAGVGELADLAISGDPLSIDDLKQRYNEDVQARRRQEALAPKYGEIPKGVPFIGGAPITESTLAEIGGSIIDAPINVGARIFKGIAGLGQKGKTALELAEQAKNMSTLQKVAQTGAKGAATGAAQTAVQTIALEPTGFTGDGELGLGEFASNVATGGLIGGTISGAPTAVAGGVRAVKEGVTAAIPGTLSTFLGVNKGLIKQYMANINNAQTKGEVAELFGKTADELAERIKTTGMTYKEAKAALGELEDQLRSDWKYKKLEAKGALDVAQKDFKFEKFEAKRIMDAAKAKLDDAWMAQQEQFKRARPPVQLVDDITDSLEQLKKQVSIESGESYKILEKAKKPIALKDIGKDIEAVQKDLLVEGQLLSKDAQKAFTVVDEWKEKIANLGKSAQPASVKRVIQELDKDIRLYGDRMAGEFSGDAFDSLMKIRRSLDERIKEIPGYADQMKKVYALNELRKEAVSEFGDQSKAMSRLASIDSVKNKPLIDLLNKLGIETKKDFMPAISSYQKLKEIAKSPMAQDELMARMPEFQEYQKAQAGFKRFADPTDIAGEVVRQKEKLYQYFQDPRNAEAFLREGLETSPTKRLQNLQAAEAAYNKALQGKAWTQEFRIGSRNVNVFTALGALFGVSVGGPEMAIATASLAAAYGAIVDRYGPAHTKKILDGMAKIQGWPTIQKINQLQVPPEIKASLQRELIQSAIILNREPVTITPENKAAIVKDISNSKASNIDKAKMLNEIEENGQVSQPGRFMVGDKMEAKFKIPQKKPVFNGRKAENY